MGRSWQSGAETDLVAALVEQRRRLETREAVARRADRAEARHRRNSLSLAALALIAALTAILVVYETNPGSTVSLIALLAGPLFAGVSGAII